MNYPRSGCPRAWLGYVLGWALIALLPLLAWQFAVWVAAGCP